MDSAQHETVIIGAGVIGAALAYRLSTSGTPVTVIDRATPATGASGAGFSWVNAAHKTPSDYFRLNAKGVAAHHAWRAALPGASWFHPVGNIELTRRGETTAALEARSEELATAGYPVRRMAGAEARDAVPGLQIPDGAGVFHFQDEGWVDAPAMTHDLLHRAVQAGAALRTHDPVVGIERSANGRVAAVRLRSGGTVSGAEFVIAAGNGASALLSELGAPDPLTSGDGHPGPRTGPGAPHPTVGMVVETTAVADAPRPVVHAPGISFRPAPNGGLTLTDNPTAAQWSRADPRLWDVPALLMERAARLLPQLHGAHIAQVRVGERVLPVDGLSVAGRLPGAPNAYLVVTHSGVTLAPFLAELIADEIGGAERGELAGFRPDRFERR
ncbi:glycine/D-amino acid oxidase-like deaminating enzyme [Murinocardiopsis flavida]|uniref:Glycine/D-amino acid oxidase-like deaminating enzyme n=1 Tax=Murinocardiopsis flavida TaxID=645275 RepID=A0A2P8DUI7_9ACTN|nr:FAD-dependent oxidoreductase [Murinocardiopsis flavida]PSL00871.1 glycine/D-amino acid oxidase-like deaminating enzyme [Murinocardiopsis flavida]